MDYKDCCILEQVLTGSKYYLIAGNSDCLEVVKVNDSARGFVHKVNKSFWKVVECKKRKDEICNNFLCIEE